MCLVPCVLVAGRIQSMCVDGLELFLFGPSAVAKLWNTTKPVNAPFILRCYIVHIQPRQYITVFIQILHFWLSHSSLLHEAGQEFVNVCASLQEVFGYLLRLLFSLVGCNF